MTEHPSIRRAYAAAAARDPGETGFLQALEVLYDSVAPCLEEQPQIAAEGLLERLGEPERTAAFPVLWQDGWGRLRQARGFFIQYCTALGPCRGGLVFRGGMDMAAAKALALEDTLEKSLAGVPLGGGLAGADVSTAEMGDRELRRFCRSFLEGLYPFLPAGADPKDWTGLVSQRELDLLAGQYAKLQALMPGSRETVREPEGPVMSRCQATGHGLCLFAQLALRQSGGPGLESQTVAVSGLDGPALWAGERAARMGAKVAAIGDESGCLYAGGGLPVSLMQNMAAQPGLPLLLWALRAPGVEYRPGPVLWDIPADAVFLCDGHTRLNGATARRLTALRPAGVFEGVPRACTALAARILAGSGILYAPAIAAGAGGAAMAYRQGRTPLTRWEADRQLRSVMEEVFRAVEEERVPLGQGRDMTHAALAAAFRRIAGVMLAKGL